MRHIWVLLWRHFVMRYRTCLTLVEYLLPSISILLMAIITRGGDDDEELSYRNLLNEYEGNVLYTPGTNFTDLLMDEVGRRLHLTRLDHLPSEEELGYYMFANESSLTMMRYSRDVMTPEDAIVIFEIMDSNTMPKELKYTIRMKTDFTFGETEPFEIDDDGHIFLNIFQLLSQNTYELEYKAFLGVQWAIDNSYLRLRTGEDINQNQILQPMHKNETQQKHQMKNVAPFMFALIIFPWTFIISTALWVSKLFVEKNEGLHELQKLSGVPAETIALSHVLNYMPTVLLFVTAATLFYQLSGHVSHTGACHIIIPMVLYPLTLIAFSFTLLYLFNISSAQYAQLVIFGIMMMFWVLALVALRVRSRGSGLACLLLLHKPFIRYFFILMLREINGRGITWANMWSIGRLIMSPGDTYVFMLLQILLFSLLAWYLSKVRPGNHGQPLPWGFIFTKKYWSKEKRDETVPVQIQFANEDEYPYFEKPPANLPVGVQVINVHKSFGDEPVLLGVNLSVYRGEITVLLGHNGAGKTTLINIITGIMPASSGRVLVEGLDTFYKPMEARKHFGLCPQHDMFFNNFTVREHVIFYALLKGQKWAESKRSAAELLAKLRFSDKADEMPKKLSGGQKRRAQLACAVAGGTSFLMLDEPTSGLDVETRRELWDLLLSLRGEHTVLLTTHFMEEADALGDRIVCLHHGRVRCHATAMFLKRAIGTGYRVTFTTFGTPMEEAITRTISAVVPDATIRDRWPNGISYNLPANDTERFPALFTAIEDARLELQIDTIGVGKSTLDEVFLKLCRDETEEEAITFEAPPVERVTGYKLYCRQFAVLLLRQWRYMSIIIYILMLIIMGILIFLMTFASNRDDEQYSVPSQMDMFGAEPEERSSVNVDNGTLRQSFSGVQFDQLGYIGAAVRFGEKYAVVIEINDNSAKAQYTPALRHAAPVALNALTNALAARALDTDARTLTARSLPIRGAYLPYENLKFLLPKEDNRVSSWVQFISLIVLCYLCAQSGLPCAERLSGARHAHVMAGTPRALHWAATLVVHVLRTLPIIVLIAVCPLIVDQDQTFDQPGFMCSVVAVLLLGTLAELGLVYLCSTLFSQMVSIGVLLAIAYVFVLMAVHIKYQNSINQLLNILFVMFPPYAFATGLKQVAYVAQLNGFCNLNREMCPELVVPGNFSPEICCDSEDDSEPWGYFMIYDGAGLTMIILGIQAVTYLMVTYFLDDGAFERCLTKAKAQDLRFADPAVVAETAYVQNTIKLPNDRIPDSVLCYNVQKYYINGCKGDDVAAVKGISFSVKKGECFGLLGVNGAGKTTTFKMLTGETAPSKGEIFANGYRVIERRFYMPTLSYCPQFGGIDNFLTGRQNLTLLLTLRGLKPDDVAKVTASWIKEVDIGKHADKRLMSYSGGNARRLTAAAALCQAARTAVLDEPTAGVDPVARRLMHRGITRAKRHCSIIVASHSLDEIEALCHRIAIMSGGEIRALGSAAALKSQYAQGYSIVFKLVAENVNDDDLNKFKEQLHERLPGEVKDYFRSILRYHVKGAFRYSELFRHLEQLREQFPLVDDYTVTETTLEEVFLALAKEAKEQAPSTASA